MTTSVRIEQLESVPIAVVRRRVNASALSRVVPECCGVVWNAVRAQQVAAGRHVAIYWDRSIQLEVGVELYGRFAETGDVVCSATPAGIAASAIHLGSYAELGATHEAIQAWCRANGRHLIAPSWEIYGHWQAEWNTNASAIRTDVFYLLRT